MDQGSVKVHAHCDPLLGLPSYPPHAHLCGWSAPGDVKESGEQAIVGIGLQGKAQVTATQRCSEAWDKMGPQGANGATL